MSRAIAHAALATLLFFAALWMLDTGRLGVAALDAIAAAVNVACAFAFYMARRRA